MTGLTKITLTKQDIATGEDLNIKDILSNKEYKP